MANNNGKGKPPKDRGEHGNPPKEHQFKPGHSGNPKGRPKRDRPVGQTMLDQYIGDGPLTLNGKKVKMPHIVAVLIKLRVAALQGNISAANTYLKFAEKSGLFDYIEKFLKTEMPKRLVVEFVEGPSPPKPIVRT